MKSFLAEHLYFLSCIYFLFFWIAVFILLKDNALARKRMFIISLLFTAFNPFIQSMYLADWWHPKFIFDQFHFEDLLFTFVLTGFISGLYSLLLKYKKNSKQFVIQTKSKYLIVGVSLLILFSSFYIFKIGSFYSTILFMLFFSISIFFYIPQKILISILIGIIVACIAIPGYFIGTYLHPGWIQEYWLLKGISGKLLLGIPLGEYMFYIFDVLCTIAFQELFFAQKKN